MNFKENNLSISVSENWEKLKDFAEKHNIPVNLDELQSKFENVNQNLPFISIDELQELPFYYYNGKNTTNNFVNIVKQGLVCDDFFQLFNKFKKEYSNLQEVTNTTNEEISGDKVNNTFTEIDKYPYSLGIGINYTYESNFPLQIRKILLKASELQYNELDNLLINILDQEISGSGSNVKNHISDNDMSLFKTFYLNYYSVYFSNELEQAENNIYADEVDNDWKNEVSILDVVHAIKDKKDQADEDNDDDNCITYSIELKALLFGVSVTLESTFDSNKKVIKGTFDKGLSNNDLFKWMGIGSEIDDLPNEIKKNYSFVSFELTIEKKTVAISLSHPNCAITVILGKDKAIYFALKQREHIVNKNNFEKFLELLHINSFGLLIKNKPETEIDIVLPSDSSNDKLKVFSKDFLKEYNILLFAEIQILSSDDFATIKDAFKIEKLNAYIALNTIAGQRKIAGVLEVANLKYESFTAESFRLVVQANIDGKGFSFAIEGDFQLDLENGDPLNFYVGGKVSTGGFYITGNIKPGFQLRLTDHLSFSEVGLLLGYSAIDGFDIGFQGRMTINENDFSYSVFMAAQVGILGAKVKPKMFSIALAPSTDQPVTLAQLITTMFGLPKSFPMPPLFYVYGIGDVFLANKSGVNLTPNLPTTGKNLPATQEYLLNEFNAIIPESIAISKSNVIVNELKTKVDSHYLITDNAKKIHYRLSRNGNVFLNAQFYYCIEDTQIGNNSYKKGIFTAATLSLFGQKFVVLFQSNFSNLEAYATMQPLDLWGLLKIGASEFVPKGNNAVLATSNELFSLVRQNASKEKGPEFYLKLNKDSLQPLEAMLIQGRVSLLNIFTIDTYISLKDSILINSYINFLNLSLELKFETSSSDDDIKKIDFSMNFTASDFSEVIQNLKNKVSNASNDLKSRLNQARVNVDTERDRLYNQEKRRKELEWDNLSWYEKAWRCITDFVGDAWSYAVRVVSKMQNIIIDGLVLLVEVGSQAFNVLLTCVEKLVSLIGQLISINSFFVEAHSSYNTRNRDLRFKFASKLDVHIFGRKYNPTFDLNLDFSTMSREGFVGAVKTGLQNALFDNISKTDELKGAFGGNGLKDENDKPEYEYPSIKRMNELEQEAAESLEKVKMSDEYVSFFKDLMNDPIALENFFNQNNATPEDRENIMKVLKNDLLDPSAPMENFVNVLVDDEFKNTFGELSEIVKNDDVFDESHSELLNSMNDMIYNISDNVLKAKKVRSKILENRTRDRYKHEIRYEESKLKKKEIRKKAIIKQLKAGIPLDFVSLGSDEVFKQIINEINDPEIMKLATDALNEFYNKQR